MSSADLFLAMIAILFPPIAVWIKRGICSCDSLLNLILCMLGFIPGLLHAWYIIVTYPDAASIALADDSATDSEARLVIYQYVGRDGRTVQAPKPVKPSADPALRAQNARGASGYGTVTPAAAVAAPAAPEEAGPADSGAQAGVPPSYAEAVQGDHKVQT